MADATDKRLDRREEREEDENTDLRGSALPELDPLAKGNEVQGHLAAPGLDPTPTPVTSDWGETLVRQTLSDLENEMTAGEHLHEHRTEEPAAPEADREEASLPIRGR